MKRSTTENSSSTLVSKTFACLDKEETHAIAPLSQGIWGVVTMTSRKTANERRWNVSTGDGSCSCSAHAAYEERHLPAGILDISRLAVHADALEEAGCTDTAPAP